VPLQLAGLVATSTPSNLVPRSPTPRHPRSEAQELGFAKRALEVRLGRRVAALLGHSKGATDALLYAGCYAQQVWLLAWRPGGALVAAEAWLQLVAPPVARCDATRAGARATHMARAPVCCACASFACVCLCAHTRTVWAGAVHCQPGGAPECGAGRHTATGAAGAGPAAGAGAGARRRVSGRRRCGAAMLRLRSRAACWP
jgi:hypothetical protein